MILFPDPRLVNDQYFARIDGRFVNSSDATFVQN